MGMQYRVDIAGVTYTMQDIHTATITQPLFDKMSVGNACCAELDISFWQKSDIPRMAEIRPFCREDLYGAWTPLGVFFIDTRETVGDLTNVVAYDSMLKSEITWTPRRGFKFPATDQQIANDVAASMDVTLDPRCRFSGYVMQEYPTLEYSRRDALRDIAAAHAGNWIITANNQLLLIPLLTSLPPETNYLVTEYGNAITFGGTRILLFGQYTPVVRYTISVNVEPIGGGTASGGGRYKENQSVTVVAVPASGSTFVGWRENGNIVNTSERYTFNATGHRDLTAVFDIKVPVYTITVSVSPAMSGTVSGGGRYTQGSSVTLTARGNVGYAFDGWMENGTKVSQQAAYTFTATANRTLTATFKEAQGFLIETFVSPEGGGTISGGGTYPEGSQATVTAVPNPGYKFLGWTEQTGPTAEDGVIGTGEIGKAKIMEG